MQVKTSGVGLPRRELAVRGQEQNKDAELLQ